VEPDRNSLRAALRQRFPRDHCELLPALHFLQHRFGYLPEWAMEVVGWHLGIPSSEVYGAATSYTELRTDQPGAGIVRVCTGLSCRLNGGAEILDAVRSGLGVTSSATLEETPCAFLCGLAPAVEVDGRWRGRVDAASIGGLTREVVRP
jgi:NADH:ubiquinone oxidoreductase subunit E